MLRKELLFWILPIFFISNQVVSTELPVELTNEEAYQLTSMSYQPQFTEIPTNPNVTKEIQTYVDKELTVEEATIRPNQTFQIQSILVNNQNKQVFQLSNGNYILADTEVIYDDVIVQQETVQRDYWLTDNFTVYSSPIENQARKLATNLNPYQSVVATEIISSHWDTFAKISGVGWIKLKQLSEEDNRIESVQKLLDQRYQSDKFSIYVKQLSTEKEAAINADKQMYAASISKLPVLYYSQKQVDKGQYNLQQGLQYIDKVTSFKGSYSPEGSGSLSKIADNKHYRIDQLMDLTAKYSDNAASNLLAYYLTDQFDEAFYSEITNITKEKWDMQTRLASSKMAGLMMEAIYYQNGYALQSLTGTNFDDQRIAKDIPTKISHKIGDAYDVKHDVAIVYTDSPFILSIFTDKSDYDTISQIAKDIYDILK